MEPLLLSNIPLHFQLKHEAKFPHKNCRATTLYSTKIPKKKKKPNNGIFFAQIIFLSYTLQISNCFALPMAQICSLPHTKSFFSLSLSLSLSLLPIAHIFFISHSKFQIFFPFTHNPKTTYTNSLKHMLKGKF